MGGFRTCPRPSTVSGTAGKIHQTQSLEGKPDSSVCLSRAPLAHHWPPPRPWPTPSRASSGLHFSASLCRSQAEPPGTPSPASSSSDCFCSHSTIFLDTPLPHKPSPLTHHSFPRKFSIQEFQRLGETKGLGAVHLDPHPAQFLVCMMYIFSFIKRNKSSKVIMLNELT